MDPASSSHITSASREFITFCPRTPPPHSTFSTDSHLPSPKGSPGKFSRLFDTLRGKLRRNSHCPSEDGSPKSSGFKKSVIGLFETVRSYGSPGRSTGRNLGARQYDTSFSLTRARTASPTKENDKILTEFGYQPKRRKSLGDLFGGSSTLRTITNRLSLGRSSVLQGIPPQSRVSGEAQTGTIHEGANLSDCMSQLQENHWLNHIQDDHCLSPIQEIRPTPTRIPIQVPQMRSTRVMGDIMEDLELSSDPVEGSVNSVKVISTRTVNRRLFDVVSSAKRTEGCSQTPVCAEKQIRFLNMVVKSPDIKEERPHTPDSYLGDIIDLYEKHPELQKELPTTSDSDPCLLSDAFKSQQTPSDTVVDEEERSETPHSFLRLLAQPYKDLVDSPIPQVDEQVSLFPSPDRLSGRLLIDFLGHDKESQKRKYYRPSSVPQQHATLHYGLYLSPATSQPTSVRHLNRPPVISVREVDPSFDLEDIDPAFCLRDLKRTKRYENLATHVGLGLDPGFTWDPNRERVEHSIKMTVAKMTKNYHMAASSDETLSGPSNYQPAEDVKKDASDFEKDQMETWDSVIRGIKVQQEVKPLKVLRSFPSRDQLFQRSPSTEKILEESIDFRTPLESKPFKCFNSQNDLIQEYYQTNQELGGLNLVYGLETSLATGPKRFDSSFLPNRRLQESIEREPSPNTHIKEGGHTGRESAHCSLVKKGFDIRSLPNFPPLLEPICQSCQPEKQHPSPQPKEGASVSVTVEFPGTIELPTHSEKYKSRAEAIDALYNYKLSELSNFCIFDPVTQTIYARSLDEGVPNPRALKRHDVELLWIPIRDGTVFDAVLEDIYKYGDSETSSCTSSIGFSNFHDLSENRMDLPTRVDSPLETDDIRIINGRTFSNNQTSRACSIDDELQRDIKWYDTLCDLQKKLCAEIAGHGKKAEQESHALEDDTFDRIFDDSFFSEADPEVDCETAAAFMGSQSETYSDLERLQEQLARFDSATELTIEIPEESEIPDCKTWTELARAYLAFHPVRSVRESEIDTRSIISTEISDFSLGEPVSIGSSVGLPSITNLELSGLFDFFDSEGSRKISQQYSSTSSDTNSYSDIFAQKIKEEYSYPRPEPLRRKQKSARKLLAWLKRSEIRSSKPSYDSYSTKNTTDDKVLEESIDESISGTRTPANTETGSVNLSRTQSPTSNVSEIQKNLEPCGLHHVYPFLVDENSVGTYQKGSEEDYPGYRSYRAIKFDDKVFLRELKSDPSSGDSQGVQKQSNSSSESSSESDDDKGVDQKDSTKEGSGLDESKAARENYIMSFPAGFSFTGYTDRLRPFEENTHRDQIVKERQISGASVRHGFHFTSYADQLRNADEETGGDELVDHAMVSLPAGWSFAAYRDQIYSENIEFDRPGSDQGPSGSDKPMKDSKQPMPCSVPDIPFTVYNKQLRERSEGSVSSLRGGRRGSSRFDGSKDCDRGDNGKGQRALITRDKVLVDGANQSKIDSVNSGNSLETLRANHHDQLTTDLELPKIFRFQSDTSSDPARIVEAVHIFDGDKKGITLEDLNIRLVGKTTRSGMASQKKKRDAALPEVVHARSFLPSTFRPVLPKMPSPTNFFHRSVGRPAATSTRIVTPSGTFYCPSGTGCVPATDRSFSPSPTKRVPTPYTRPPSQTSNTTELSSNFGEPLQRAEQCGGKEED